MSRCPIDHAALKSDAAAWRALRYVGIQSFDFEDGTPIERHELRNCICGMTLDIPLTTEPENTL